ncbi:MAG TPA: ankyrin repeat domain-containing protein, partial [Steroidobacteraceae bacterium]|nr:ankyrin repeat domain-containing protein [Steroidobacteraceae bacterium]
GEPPSQDPPEEIDDHYRRTSALDPSRPSESVRRAVLAHAAQLAAERTARKEPIKIDTSQPAANQASWRGPAIFGTLAAAALAGLLIAPQYLIPSHPPVTALSPGQVRPETADSEPTPAADQLAAQPPPPATATDRSPPPASPAAPAQPRSIPKPRMLARSGSPQPIENYAQLPQESRRAAVPAASPAQNENPAAEVAQPQPMAPRIARSASAAAPMAALSGHAEAFGGGVQAGRPADSAADLRRAADTGDMQKLRVLLDQQVDIEARDASGRTALMLATLRGRAAAVDALLASGADPNAADASGTRPLQAAVANDQQAIAAALRRAGAR